MAVTRTANQPITFSGQIVEYGEGVANTMQSSVMVETTDVPVRFSNSQGTVQYSPSTGTPVVYTAV